MTADEVREVIDTYEGLIERAQRANNRRLSERKAWAREATALLMTQAES